MIGICKSLNWPLFHIRSQGYLETEHHLSISKADQHDLRVQNFISQTDPHAPAAPWSQIHIQGELYVLDKFRYKAKLHALLKLRYKAELFALHKFRCRADLHALPRSQIFSCSVVVSTSRLRGLISLLEQMLR